MRERVIFLQKNAANRAIREAKTMMRAENFKSAITKVEEAISLYSTHIPNGKEMLTVCKILHKSQTFQPQPDEESWPYDLLQIPSSSTLLQVEYRYKNLLNDLVLLKDRKFLLAKSASFAAKFLRQAMSAYDRYRVIVPSDDDDEEDGGDGTGDDEAAADDGNGGNGDDAEEEDSNDDPLAARSPEFKKLRTGTYLQHHHNNPILGP
ncbi:uncharacterized protein LOC113334795 [Papaver somniferum]|uniref:uncharacterized protein LOC113334795 n=1 Tax=Papaver somniferum TaxID=3469 RepID=UPI000E6FE282|nr:uncharacterized protein LOC113334795 [Papaver somniferum]